MTRKDYTAIAKALADQHPVPVVRDDVYLARVAQWRYDVLAITEALVQLSPYGTNGNRLFDRDRFMAAAGVSR